MYHGDIRLGDTIDIKFCTVNTSGVPTTLSGTPAISAYPGNSTTEITAGITLSADFDSRTGLNNCRVVASSGNGYATATNYTLVITTGTVSGSSVVGYCIGSFSIENRSALMPTTAARTLVVDAAGLADANVVKLGPSGSGTAQTARDIGSSVLLSNGTGTGQVSFTSGILSVNTTQLGGSATPVTNLAAAASTIVPGTVDTAGFSPTTSAFETSSITEATADHFVGRLVIFRSGALLYQQALITAYSLVSGRGRFTVTTMTDAPANGDSFAIV